MTKYISFPGVVACTCNSATLQAECGNDVGLILVRGNSLSLGKSVDCVNTCDSEQGEEPD